MWWLIRNNFKASSVYLYVTVLLVGEAVRSWVNVKGRMLALDNDGSFLPFTLEWLWSARTLLTFFGILAITTHMTYRVVTKKDPEIPEAWTAKVHKWLGFK